MHSTSYFKPEAGSETGSNFFLVETYLDWIHRFCIGFGIISLKIAMGLDQRWFHLRSELFAPLVYILSSVDCWGKPMHMRGVLGWRFNNKPKSPISGTARSWPYDVRVRKKEHWKGIARHLKWIRSVQNIKWSTWL